MVMVGKLQVTAAVSSPPLVPIPDKLVAPPPPLDRHQETPIKMLFSQPRVDPLTMTVSPSYSYGYSLSDKVSF